MASFIAQDSQEQTRANPLDIIEQIVSSNEWPFERRNDEEIAVEVPGRWCGYSLFFAWRESMSAMHFTCTLDMRVPEACTAAIAELLVLINAKMWLGHFSLWGELPLFRHTVLLRGAPHVSVEQLEDLVDIALTESDRFYPAFQFVIWGGKTPREALEAAMIDPVGQA